MLNYLQWFIMAVVSVSVTVQGSNEELLVAANLHRADGSYESYDQNLATVTETDEGFVDSTTPGTGTTHDRALFKETPIMDAITIVWYLATFIALISFFLVMACADRNRCRSRKPAQEELTPPPTPAPSYRQFAPPNYDTLVFEKDNDSIFIIPYDARIESEHQRNAESLANDLEEIIVQPNVSNDHVPTSDIRNEEDGDAGSDTTSVPAVSSSAC
ncbi:AGAP005241-PA-like protein [Anopheles sinensis]|uniref:AGAP005241-PA-like protein n=1 Tax=Anopheles sinensis TaxID=74873 RepID=A0A084WRX2_ANOSI|nr:AGAP005241-PA-like protein [Anopheles sinensis]